MNRKDTIIIAVLINAGLLALLFMMAINTDEEMIIDQSVNVNSIAEHQAVPVLTLPSESLNSQSQAQLLTSSSSKVLVEVDANSVDEMDNFLKDLSTNPLSQSAFVDDEGTIDPDTVVEQALFSEKIEDNRKSEIRLVEITVKRGDALEKIARNNGTTVETIKKINKLNSSKLNIGQVLRVPVAGAASARPASIVKSNGVADNSVASKTLDPKATAASEIKYYTIKSGDNPWKIAKEHKVKYDDILKWNGMDEEKARNLKVGDKIRVK